MGSFFTILIVVVVACGLFYFLMSSSQTSTDRLTAFENKIKERLNELFSSLKYDFEKQMESKLRELEQKFHLMQQKQDKLIAELNELKKTPEEINRSTLNSFLGGIV